MQDDSDWLLWTVVGGAFIAGYFIVSYIINWLKDLQNRPSLYDEIWREEAEARKERVTGKDWLEPERETKLHQTHVPAGEDAPRSSADEGGTSQEQDRLKQDPAVTPATVVKNTK